MWGFAVACEFWLLPAVGSTNETFYGIFHFVTSGLCGLVEDFQSAYGLLYSMQCKHFTDPLIGTFLWCSFIAIFISLSRRTRHSYKNVAHSDIHIWIYAFFLSFSEMQRQSVRKRWHMLDQWWIVLLCMSCRWVDTNTVTTLYFQLLHLIYCNN